MSWVQHFNTGPWTEEEHQRFLMGLEEYHRGGGWSSFERFILTRSLLQIDAYATAYFSTTPEGPEEGQAPPFPEQQADQFSTTTAAAVVAAHQQRRGVPGGRSPYPAAVVWESLTNEEATRRTPVGDDPCGVL